MTVIDLTPPERLARKAMRQRLRRWVQRLGVLAAFSLVSYVALARVAAAREEKLDTVTGKYALLQERLRKAESLLEERDNLDRHQEAISLIRNKRTAGWYLELLGGTLAGDSYLTRFDLDLCAYSDSKIWGNLNKDECTPSLVIEGHAAGHQQVGKIIGHMNATGVFREVSLISIQIPTGGDGKGGVDFEIHCSIPPRNAGT